MSFFSKAAAFCREKNYIKYLFSFLALMILSAALTVIALALTVVPFDESRFYVLLEDALLFCLNGLPILIVMSTVYLLSGRMWIGFSITGLFTFLIAEINRLKIFYREDPFVYSDLLLVKETGKMLESYDITFDMTSWITLAIIIVISVLCFFFLGRLNLKFRLMNTVIRVVISIILVVILAFAGNNLYFKNGKIYQELWHEDFGSVWNECDNYSSRGVIYSFLRSASIPPVTEPYNYDEDLTKEIFDNYSDIMLPEDKKVNVISVMLEAFADFSECEDIEFVTDPYANFRNIKENSYSGTLVANVFGGGTIETERAFLAGISNSNIYKRDTLSYVRYFKENGYFTEAMHPYYGWFYNRNNINRYLGFDSFKTFENSFSGMPAESLLEETYFGILSDTDVFDAIKKSFEETVARNEKYFNFTVTYQNHGPYYTYPTTDREILKKNESYSEENYNEANNYFYGISKTDASLGKLIEYIDSRNEPIVFIAFGDHKPGFSEETYEMIGVKLDFSTIEGINNYYNVPYFFYANDAAKEALGKDFKEAGETISPMFLMNELFDYVELDGSAYLNYMSDVKKEYDVIHYSLCAKDGEFLFRINIQDAAIFEERQNVEYYMKNLKIRKSS